MGNNTDNVLTPSTPERVAQYNNDPRRENECEAGKERQAWRGGRGWSGRRKRRGVRVTEGGRTYGWMSGKRRLDGKQPE